MKEHKFSRVVRERATGWLVMSVPACREILNEVTCRLVHFRDAFLLVGPTVLILVALVLMLRLHPSHIHTDDVVLVAAKGCGLHIFPFSQSFCSAPRPCLPIYLLSSDAFDRNQGKMYCSYEPSIYHSVIDGIATHLYYITGSTPLRFTIECLRQLRTHVQIIKGETFSGQIIIKTAMPYLDIASLDRIK